MFERRASRSRIRIAEACALSRLALDVGVDDLGKVLALKLGGREVNVDGLSATVTGGDGSGTVGRNTVDLLEIGLVGKRAVTKWYKVDTVVDEERKRGEVRRLVTAVLRAGRGEDGTKLADQSTRRPESTGLVKEGRYLSRRTTVASGETKDKPIVLGKLLGRNDGERRDGSLVGVHLGQDLIRERLRDLVNVDGSTSRGNSLLDRFRKLGNVAIERENDDSDLGHLDRSNRSGGGVSGVGRLG